MEGRSQLLEMPDNQAIATNLRDLMNIHKISEAQLAQALNVSVMTIRRVVSGETTDPRISTLSLIADYFKISVDSLLEKKKVPINLMQENKPYFIPIMEWDSLQEFCSCGNFDLNKWPTWYPIVKTASLTLEERTFALKSKISMQPRYPKNTLLIISPTNDVMDNDILLIKIKTSNSFSLRELTIDSPNWILHPVVFGSERIFYNKDEHDIIGVVVLTLLQTRDKF